MANAVPGYIKPFGVDSVYLSEEHYLLIAVFHPCWSPYKRNYKNKLLFAIFCPYQQPLSEIGLDSP